MAPLFSDVKNGIASKLPWHKIPCCKQCIRLYKLIVIYHYKKLEKHV